VIAVSETADTSESPERYLREPFGFVWGETGETTWLRTDDGSYKRIDPAFVDQLFELADGSVDPDTVDPDVTRAIEVLSAEGYLELGGSVRRHEPPDGIRLGPRIVAVCLLFVSTATILAAQRTVLIDALGTLDRTTVLFVIVPGIIVGISLHETAHYVASRPYFEPTFRVGTLNKILPAIITRTTDAWSCPRSVRIWISLAGPFVDAAIAFVCALVFVLAPERSLAGVLALIFFLRGLFVLNPLIEGDGYWILTDTLETYNLRTRGFRDLRQRHLSWPAVYALLSLCFTICLGVVLAVLVTRLVI